MGVSVWESVNANRLALKAARKKKICLAKETMFTPPSGFALATATSLMVPYTEAQAVPCLVLN